MTLVDSAQLGLPASGDDRHHSVADLRALDCRAERDDLACQFEAGDVGRGAGRSRVEAGSLEPVGAV